MGLGSEVEARIFLRGVAVDSGAWPCLPWHPQPRGCPKPDPPVTDGPAAHPQRSPGSYEVILFLLILGKNSKYKIILIKVKIHYLDFVVF